MGDGSTNARGPRLVAFHAALVAYLKQKGRLTDTLDVPTWTQLVVVCMSDPLRGSVVSRQTVQDITFSMEHLGMVKRKKGKGVVVVEGFSPELWQSEPSTPEAAAPA